MQRGTPVSDRRLSRRIGYWTGQGLSEDLPKKNDDDAASEMEIPTVGAQVAIVESEPESERGFEAASWILLNTPDGAEVEKAGKAILEHHLQNTNLMTLAERLESLRPRCAKTLLKEILAKNPVAEIRCMACFSLAMTLRDEAEFGANRSATAQARSYFQRVIAEFSKAGQQGVDKSWKSTRAIQEMDHLWIGSPAPELSIPSDAGEARKLSDYRGRVVLLIFRSDKGYSEVEEHQRLFAKFAEKGVQFVNIVCDQEADKKSAVNWPTVLNGRRGPIAETFMIRSWTSTFLIGKDGAIRARDLIWEKLEQGIESAVKE